MCRKSSRADPLTPTRPPFLPRCPAAPFSLASQSVKTVSPETFSLPCRPSILL
jgi:hypothetical protein